MACAFFWLLEDPNGYIYPLTSDFDFIYLTGVKFILDDLTGDGSPEAIIYRTVPGANQSHLPRIFNTATSHHRNLLRFTFHLKSAGL
jgi:hypothetical protein